MSALTPSAAYGSDNLRVRMDVDRLKKGRLFRSMPGEEAIIFGDLVGKLRILRLDCPKCGHGVSTSLTGLSSDTGTTGNYSNGWKVCWSTAHGCRRRIQTIRARLCFRTSQKSCSVCCPRAKWVASPSQDCRGISGTLNPLGPRLVPTWTR